jgi:hypothetical protein
MEKKEEEGARDKHSLKDWSAMEVRRNEVFLGTESSSQGLLH